MSSSNKCEQLVAEEHATTTEETWQLFPNEVAGEVASFLDETGAADVARSCRGWLQGVLYSETFWGRFQPLTSKPEEPSRGVYRARRCFLPSTIHPYFGELHKKFVVHSQRQGIPNFFTFLWRRRNAVLPRNSKNRMPFNITFGSETFPKAGMGNNKCVSHPVNPVGNSDFDVIEPFIPLELLRGIYAHGFEKMSFIQQNALLPCLCPKQDVVVCSTGGTGKTALMAIAVLQRVSPEKFIAATAPSEVPCEAIILVPTRELAVGTQCLIHNLGEFMFPKEGCTAPSATTSSGSPPLLKHWIVTFGPPHLTGFTSTPRLSGTWTVEEPTNNLLSINPTPRAHSLHGSLIYISTPGRFQDTLQRREETVESLQKEFNLTQLKVLVFDQLDDQLQKGFQLAELFRLIAKFNQDDREDPAVESEESTCMPTVQRIFCTNTLSSNTLMHVQKMVRTQPSLPWKTDESKEGDEKGQDEAHPHRNTEHLPPPLFLFDRNRSELTLEGIKQFFVAINSEEEKLETLVELFESVSIAQCVVICNTQRRVEYVAEKLRYVPLPSVEELHNGTGIGERSRVAERLRSGISRVLVTTDSFANNRDFSYLSTTVQYDLPLDNESYLARIGRSGAYGRRCVSIAFVTESEVSRLKQIERFYSTEIAECPMNIADHF